MTNFEMPTTSTVPEQRESSNEVLISPEEIKNHKIEADPEDNLAEHLAEIPEKDRSILNRLAKLLPPQAKAEIIEAFRTQVDTLRALRDALSEKIDWKMVDKKRAAAYALYALGSVIGAVSTAEAGEDNDPTGENLKEFFMDHALDNSRQLEEMGVNTQTGELYMEKALELYKAFSANDYPSLYLQQTLTEMTEFTRFALKQGGTLKGLELGYDEIIQNFIEEASTSIAPENEEQDQDTSISQKQDSTENETENNMDENFGLLLEKEALNFSEQYTDYERSQIQRYHDNGIEVIHEIAEQFNDWKNKYGHKSKFTAFENEVTKYIANESEQLLHIRESVANPDAPKIKVNVQSVGNPPTRSSAEASLNIIDSTVELRSFDEIRRDAEESFKRAIEESF